MPKGKKGKRKDCDIRSLQTTPNLSRRGTKEKGKEDVFQGGGLGELCHSHQKRGRKGRGRRKPLQASPFFLHPPERGGGGEREEGKDDRRAVPSGQVGAGGEGGGGTKGGRVGKDCFSSARVTAEEKKGGRRGEGRGRTVGRPPPN